MQVWTELGGPPGEKAQAQVTTCFRLLPPLYSAELAVATGDMGPVWRPLPVLAEDP